MKFLKDCFSELVIGLTVAILAIVVASRIAHAAITAPVSVDAGQLAVAKSDVPAVWTVYPAQYQTAIYVADNGTTLIFASPEKGEVTFIAASNKDGDIEMSQHTLYNGVPAPTPDKDKDKQEDKSKTPLERAIATVKDYPAEDVNALAETFDEVVSGIDRGTISTPAAARETFRSLWAIKAIKVAPEALTRTAPLVTELSNAVDNTTVQTIKADYETIVKALKGQNPAKAPAKSPQPKLVPACPNGQCNRYYWSY